MAKRSKPQMLTNVMSEAETMATLRKRMHELEDAASAAKNAAEDLDEQVRDLTGRNAWTMDVLHRLLQHTLWQQSGTGNPWTDPEIRDVLREYRRLAGESASFS